ncbi:MAG: 30S ribosomal protein S17 [Clostridia bacterium]
MENIERNARITKEGIVVGAGKMQKTIIVAVTSDKKHPLYKKVVSSTKKFKVHDEENMAGIGDKVEIAETRHISKDKYFRLVSIIEKAK